MTREDKLKEIRNDLGWMTSEDMETAIDITNELFDIIEKQEKENRLLRDRLDGANSDIEDLEAKIAKLESELLEIDEDKQSYEQ